MTVTMKSMFIFLCFFKCVYNYIPFVKVKQGELFGTDYTLSNGRVVNAYLGIPYAVPPVYDLRFRAPQKLETWNEIYNATYARSDCLQIEVFKGSQLISGNEDCLYLNVYTPKFIAGGKRSLLDVFVYIHGGGFTFGSGNLLPDRFLETENIVFVSMNYRLGVFGFLSINDNTASGNFGLKDQALALHWIKENIIHFGGNPASITIAGLSAGGASVQHHLISPSSKGLFHKAISFSGTVLPPWALQNDIQQKSNTIATLVECSHKNGQQMEKCLREKPATNIIQAQQILTFQMQIPIIFGPTLEPKSSNAFLSDKPTDILKRKITNDVPWLSSMVKDEGLFPAVAYIKSDSYLKMLDKEFVQMAPVLLGYNYGYTEAEKQNITFAIKNFYFGDEPITKKTAKQLIALVGDRIFYSGIIEATLRHNLASKNNIYCLKFNYRGKRSYTNLLANDFKNYGVSHGDDLQYYMKSYPADELETESDKEVSKLMVSIIVNFMKTGNPNRAIGKWEPISKQPELNMNCLNIYSSSQIVMSEISLNSPRLKFWQDILPFERWSI